MMQRLVSRDIHSTRVADILGEEETSQAFDDCMASKEIDSAKRTRCIGLLEKGLRSPVKMLDESEIPPWERASEQDLMVMDQEDEPVEPHPRQTRWAQTQSRLVHGFERGWNLAST